MEYSSPLAALRPQPCQPWGNRKDLPNTSWPTYARPTCSSTNFDFKTLSMYQKPSRPDYFSRHVRGSSPTSSLTADLDANFHIDKSPQAPTPRRALFTATAVPSRTDGGTPPIDVEPATTPGVPLSSPGYDAMDISPLPHKPPHLLVTLPSPTPEMTPDDEDMISPDMLVPGLPLVSSAPVVRPSSALPLPERKRPATRPPLVRVKSQSVYNIHARVASPATELPPFRFGNVTSHGSSCSSTPAALESSRESPMEDPRTFHVAAMLPPPRRPSLSRMNGSPSSGSVRRPALGRASGTRPHRKMVRRSMSMFQHPDDVMKEDQDMFEPQAASLLPSVMDVEPEHVPKLPYFVPDHEPDSLPRITQETMVDVLEAKYDHAFDRIVVVDCRFEYEYQGGHIVNAVNFNDKQLLAHDLFSATGADAASSTLLILHCEYSAHRAPLTAKFIRSHDRTVNAAHYPRLTYPDMYILDGGYSEFFAQHRARCVPQSYVEMNDHRHEHACERGLAKVKSQHQRQKLFRHQTFAFGQNAHDEAGADSPTNPPRATAPRSQSSVDVGADLFGRGCQRRVASY